MIDPLVSLLADLVAIPSVNPMGRGKTGAEYCEAAIAGHVASYMRRHGIDVEIDEVAPGRPNVIGRIDAGRTSTLLLEAHLDTVQVDTMTIPPFTPNVKDGKLYGRGSCDTKGSLAAFLYAVCSVIGSGGNPRHNIILAAIADEEYQFSGAKHAVARGLKADMGIAGEPTNLRIVRAHKGVTRWRIETRGVSAHSAYPERGENAIYAMGQVLRKLETYARGLSTRPSDADFGTPTLSVGVIEGGQSVNIVPDRCMIEIDRRTLPGETAESVFSPVRDLLRDVKGCEMIPPHLAVDGMDVPAESPVVMMLSNAVKQVTGKVVVEAAHYATDAGMYNKAGIPTVVFGPGDIARAHTESEYIELNQLRAAADIIRHVLL